MSSSPSDSWGFGVAARRSSGTAVGGRVVRSAGLPYYVQVAGIIRDELRAGRWEPGALIPSESGLCEMFGVSRTAIRQALGMLVDEGLLQKEKGRGTFVRQPQVALAVQELRGFYDEMAVRGRVVSNTVRRQEVVVVPPHVAPELGVPMGSEVVLLERVRGTEDGPLVHVSTYLPLRRFERLLDIDLAQRSLYAVLAEEFGVEARGGRRRIDAVAATAEQAKLLKIPAKSPVLRVTATNTDADGVAFEYFDAWYRADRTSFEIVVSARGGDEPIHRPMRSAKKG